MTNILSIGRHVVIGGTASQYQNLVVRNVAFNAVYDHHRPTTECFGQVIGVVDNASEGTAFVQAFEIWRKGNNKTPRPVAYLSLDGLRTPDELIRRADRVWRHTPVIFVRDLAGHQTKPDDLWFTRDAPELLSVYRGAAITSINTGPHVIAQPHKVKDFPGDTAWECSAADGANVTMKNVATNEVHRFRGRNIGGGMIFDAVAKDRELTS